MDSIMQQERKLYACRYFSDVSYITLISFFLFCKYYRARECIVLIKIFIINIVNFYYNFYFYVFIIKMSIFTIKINITRKLLRLIQIIKIS